MTAPTRRDDAARPAADVRGRNAHDRWREAVKIRQEWLDHGLSTEPADRQTTERGLTAIYARMSRPRPRFAWVDSPAQAVPLVAGLPTLDELYLRLRNPRASGPSPLASDLAMVASQLRGALSAGVVHVDPELAPARKGKHGERWRELPPAEALRAGVPLGVVLHQGVHTALHRSLAHGFRFAVRTVLTARGPLPVCWYGQQDAAWIAYYDVLHRLGLARYGPDQLDHLGHWAAVARSCGWWWPGEEVCVVVDRPDRIRTEAVPGAWHDEVRLGRDGVRYRDGWHPQPA
ncbi:hypothetical protein ETD83_19165 [Actinomadura soli]|uniref:DUF6745 domain-containing protein n=1 Tax=Actinomadura soli TaxID=2508997 RepID=A0A5C4J9X3_9ACTN|nr:hypothetical protein [Actinomadura soli]TMQ98439.1 hypothetical protein ETD83_19165 [Actinomadura soli]